jgi:hypothetical protein
MGSADGEPTTLLFVGSFRGQFPMADRSSENPQDDLRILVRIVSA